jgi:hypothetical protein
MVKYREVLFVILHYHTMGFDFLLAVISESFIDEYLISWNLEV